MTAKNETRDMYSTSMKDPEFRSAFEREWYIEDFLIRIEERMATLGLTRKGLAGRLGCSSANVTQLFRRKNNLTAETMVDLALAVGLRLRHQFDPIETSDTPWGSVVGCDPWTATDGARVIRFPLRKTGGGVSAKSISFPDCEPANDPAAENTKLVK